MLDPRRRTRLKGAGRRWPTRDSFGGAMNGFGRIGESGFRALARSLRLRSIACLVLAITVFNALWPLLDAVAGTTDENAGFIEICTTSGVKLIPLSATQPKATEGATQDVPASDAADTLPARQRRSSTGKMGFCPLCPVSADADDFGLLPMQAALAMAGTHTLSQAAAEPFLIHMFRLSLRARGPPADDREFV
jgi:hypothetical protein